LSRKEIRAIANTAEFIVTGEQKIHCEGCEQRIGRALKRLPGVGSVEASAQSQRVIVEMDPEQVGPEQVRERLKILGYEVIGEGGA
jgi:copper chaperone CopZ